MAAGNYTVFRAKHVDGIKFGGTAWSSTDMSSTGTALDTSFTTNNATALLDLVGAVDANNPVKSYAFGKDFTISGNERSTSEENLLGADSSGSQNAELNVDPNSKLDVECTVVYRNTTPLSIFNDSTKACLVEMDNSESATTGVLNLGFNNIKVTHVGSQAMNPDGMMEQKIKFTCRGGTSGSAISVSQASPAESWTRIRAGTDYAEEIRTA